MRSYSQDLSKGLENVPVLIEDSVSQDAFANFQVSSLYLILLVFKILSKHMVFIVIITVQLCFLP